jgi:hypothetical protein
MTLLWANAVCDVETCEDGREIGECEHTLNAHLEYDVTDFSADDLANMRADIVAMVESFPTDFAKYLDTRTAEDFGHDFALTRNGHGAGFWDRGLGDLGDRWSDRARAYGDAHVYVGTDSISLRG